MSSKYEQYDNKVCAGRDRYGSQGKLLEKKINKKLF